MIVDDVFTVRGRGLCAVVRLDRVPELGDCVRHTQSGKALRILGIERDARPLKVGSVTALLFGDRQVSAGDELTWADQQSARESSPLDP